MAQSREHPVLVEILEMNHKNIQEGIECIITWIPGHSGIAGNVRADYWAKKVHDKPDVTEVKVGHREFIPQAKQCMRERFEKMWQDYRPTLLKQIKPSTGSWMTSVRDSRKEEVVLCRMRIGAHCAHTFLYYRSNATNEL